MLKTILNSVKAIVDDRPFEHYYSAIVGETADVAPRAKEARLDYLARVRAQARLHTYLGV